MSTLMTLITQKLETLEQCGFLQLVKESYKFCLILHLLKCDIWSRNNQENAKRRHNEDSAILNVTFLLHHLWDFFLVSTRLLICNEC